MKRQNRFLAGLPFPTPRTIWAVALGMPAAAFLGWKGVLLLDLGILLLCLLDHGFNLTGGGLQAERRCPSPLYKGESHQVEIALSNPSNRSRRLQIRDQTPLPWDAAPLLKATVPARSTRILYYQTTPPNRGIYEFGGLSLRMAGPLGLAYRPFAVPAAEKVKVYPRLQPLSYHDLATQRRVSRAWGLRASRWRGEGREFEALREYTEGDDPRKIHWKATARLDRPIVQDFRPERNQSVMALVDAGRLMAAVSEGKTKLDHALEAAVHLSHAALAGGDQAGFLAFADAPLSFVPPKKTPEQLQIILEVTLEARPLLVESHYEQALLWLRTKVRRRSLVVIFTDLLDEVTSENLLAAVDLLRPRHLPLCVAIRESEWDHLLGSPPSSVQGVYQRTVLQESLRRRQLGLRALIRKGALAVDLTPERLCPGILKRYLEVKRRGLL